MAPFSTAPLAAALTLIAIAVNVASGATASAPAASAGPANLTGILSKGGQYSTFIRLLRATQILQQIQSQLNNSFNGMTVFAPTDNAFSNLKAGTLNGLGSQDQVNLVLYHVLPRYYSMSTFETASNPVSTQASGPDGAYTVNVSSTTNQVNVTTGIVETQVYNALYTDFPLAVYSVDKVLLPSALFGAKPPAVAPVKSPAPVKPAKGSSAAAKVEAPSKAVSEPLAAAGSMAGAAGWCVPLVVGLVGFGSLLRG